MAQAERDVPSSNDVTYCIGLLWSEIPLDKERHVIDRLRREGSYDTWEWALDYPLDHDDGRRPAEAVLRAKVGMYENWLREHLPDCPLLPENIVADIGAGGQSRD